MINISVLLENQTISPELKHNHGLSIYIKKNDLPSILLDAGQDDKFLFNARKLGIDISKVDTMFLSHAHYDHAGGIDFFLTENSHSKIYTFAKKNEDFYHHHFLFFREYLGLTKKLKNSERLISLAQDSQINDYTWFLQNSSQKYMKPLGNKVLYMKKNKMYKPDDFTHEGILVIEDNNELVVFNSCSHNGVANTLESVRKLFPAKRIRSYVGGFHLISSSSKNLTLNEIAVLDELIAYIKADPLTLYTGHCTSSDSLAYLKSKLGNLVQKIATGTQISI